MNVMRSDTNYQQPFEFDRQTNRSINRNTDLSRLRILDDGGGETRRRAGLAGGVHGAGHEADHVLQELRLAGGGIANDADVDVTTKIAAVGSTLCNRANDKRVIRMGYHTQNRCKVWIAKPWITNEILLEVPCRTLCTPPNNMSRTPRLISSCPKTAGATDLTMRVYRLGLSFISQIRCRSSSLHRAKRKPRTK